jgi:hypothetical protein
MLNDADSYQGVAGCKGNDVRASAFDLRSQISAWGRSQKLWGADVRKRHEKLAEMAAKEAVSETFLTLGLISPLNFRPKRIRFLKNLHAKCAISSSPVFWAAMRLGILDWGQNERCAQELMSQVEVPTNRTEGTTAAPR